MLSDRVIIKFRIFGSNDCNECKELKAAFERHAFDFDFIDVDKPENDKLADDNNVDRLPHVQAIYAHNGKTIYDHIGLIAPLALLEKVMAKENAMDDLVNKSLLAVKASPNLAKQIQQAQTSQPQPQQQKQNKHGCSSCSAKKTKPQS
jgi:hypothetical protein